MGAAMGRGLSRTVLPLALAAPLLLLAGLWTAELRQPVGVYDPIAQTASTLAGRGATDRWIMTGALLAIGVIYVLAPLGMSMMPLVGRLLLGTGGVTVVAAALAPQPAQGSSVVHMTSATIAWAAFATWPLAAASCLGPRGRWWALGATGVMVLLLGWFCDQLWSHGAWLGLTERVLLVAQTIWPITVAAALRPRRLRSEPERVRENAGALVT